MREGEPSRCRVLVLAEDRRFRALACTLLSRRGYTVTVCTRAEDLIAVAARDSADVVVIDATASLTAAAREAARLAALTPPVGIVAVSAEAHTGLTTLPVIPKWSPFEALFRAIDRVYVPVVDDEVAGAAL